jgi:hypothetical protein
VGFLLVIVCCSWHTANPLEQQTQLNDQFPVDQLALVALFDVVIGDKGPEVDKRPLGHRHDLRRLLFCEPEQALPRPGCVYQALKPVGINGKSGLGQQRIPCVSLISLERLETVDKRTRVSVRAAVLARPETPSKSLTANEGRGKLCR